MKRFALLSVVALVSLSACGGSDDVAATATEGDEFCRLAQVAADDHEVLESLDVTDSAKLKVDLSAAIDSLSAAAAKAPTDIAATINSILDDQEKLENLLEENDFDILKMSKTDEGKALAEKVGSSTEDDEFDDYLTDKCGIETPEDDEPTDDTAPVDITIPPDVTIPDITTGDPIVDLGEGEDAINQFLDFYELGTSTTLTEEQRTCIVSNLVDEVTGDELNQAISGSPTPEVQQALGQAFIDCEVEVAG